MKTTFSLGWKASKQPRKQRKYVHNAPLHIRHKMLTASLAKALKGKYKKNRVPVRTGDKVKIVRGQFKGQRGKVEAIKTKNLKIHVEGIQHTKRDGSKTFYPIHPSNVQIEELNLDDKKRRAKLEVSKK